MKRSLYILFFIVLGLSLKAQPPSKWYNKFGGYGVDIGYGVKEGYHRQYIVAGSSNSFGSSGIDAYIILVDSMGQKIWEKTFGGAMTDVAKNVIVNPVDSGFIFTGYTNSIGNGGYDLYLVKIDKNGNLIWQKSFGGLDWDFGNDIALAPDGNVIICGYTYSMGYGKKDGYILKVNSNSGVMMWEKYYGGSEDDEFRAIKVVSSNSVVVTGQTKSYNDAKGDIYFLKTDLNGDSLISRSYGLNNKEDFGNSIIQNIYSNGFVIAGGTESYSTWGKDAFIFGISAIGDSLWLVHYGNANRDQEAIDVVSTITNTFVSSYVLSYSDIDFSSYKRDPKNLMLDANGIYFSGNAFGQAEDEELYDLSNATDKGFIGVGYTRSYGAFDQDLYLIKYDSTAFFGGNLIGIKENEISVSNGIKLYPTIISKEQPILNIKSGREIAISCFDLYGKEILDIKITNAQITQVDFQNLNPGIYFIKIFQDNATTNFKVLKQN